MQAHSVVAATHPVHGLGDFLFRRRPPKSPFQDLSHSSGAECGLKHHHLAHDLRVEVVDLLAEVRTSSYLDRNEVAETREVIRGRGLPLIQMLQSRTSARRRAVGANHISLECAPPYPSRDRPDHRPRQPTLRRLFNSPAVALSNLPRWRREDGRADEGDGLANRWRGLAGVRRSIWKRFRPFCGLWLARCVLVARECVRGSVLCRREGQKWCRRTS